MNTKHSDEELLDLLHEVVDGLPDRLGDVESWGSLVINRRKPHTFRAFRNVSARHFDGVRVCLHRFEPCEAHEAFAHPHPWPGAFLVLQGRYRMRVGRADSVDGSFEHCMTLELAAGSEYAMTNELTSHSVQPLETCWSVMVNLPPWRQQHQEAPTTKGKDLETMTSAELQAHLEKFRALTG